MPNPTVFVIMPFSEEYLKIFDFLKKKLRDTYNITNGDTDNMQSIMKDVVNGINDSDFILADLTEVNANVYYELGIAHALRRKVITITQKIDELPFDLKGYRSIKYSLNFAYADKFISDIKEALDKGVAGDVEFSNPVIDYIEGVKTEVVIIENAQLEKKSEDDKGFIDLIFEISSDMDQITDSVLVISDELNDLTEQLNQKTEQINNLKSSGNKAAVNPIIDQTSIIIRDFSSQLANFNDIFDISWSKIVNNYDKLLENKFVSATKNSDNLSNEIVSLGKLSDSMTGVKKVFINFKDSSEGLIGVKATLNSAVRNLCSNVDIFIGMMEISEKNVDKIIEKHKVLYLD
ncbi:MAG: hypothetical protein KAQ68_08580 [Clostridiales bacterium]|nr:hypothetical protein [Clostridiales bacterium]